MRTALAADDPYDWLSTAEASKLLGISLRALYQYIDRGVIPAYKFGRVIRLRSHEVLAARDHDRFGHLDDL